VEPAHPLAATRGTSGTPRHTRLTRYRCSLPGLAGFAGNRCTEPEVPPIGSPRAKNFRAQNCSAKSSTAPHPTKATPVLCSSLFPNTRLYVRLSTRARNRSFNLRRHPPHSLFDGEPCTAIRDLLHSYVCYIITSGGVSYFALFSRSPERSSHLPVRRALRTIIFTPPLPGPQTCQRSPSPARHHSI